MFLIVNAEINFEDTDNKIDGIFVDVNDPAIDEISDIIETRIQPLFKMTRRQIYDTLDPRSVFAQKTDFKILDDRMHSWWNWNIQ